MADEDWAHSTGLDVFYNFHWTEPRTELLLDFLEGFDYVQPPKEGRRPSLEIGGPIRSLVHRKPVEISAYVIRAALGFESGQSLVGRCATISFQRKFAKYGVTPADHQHDGKRFAALTPPYQVRIRAMGDAIGFKQRLTYISNDLQDHVYAAEQAGARGE